MTTDNASGAGMETVAWQWRKRHTWFAGQADECHFWSEWEALQPPYMDARDLATADPENYEIRPLVLRTDATRLLAESQAHNAKLEAQVERLRETLSLIATWPQERQETNPPLAAPSEPEAQKAVAWRPKYHALTTNFTSGLPDEKTIAYWKLRDIEIEYAYASPAASMEVQGHDANAIRLATLEEAARACEKLAEERFNDHGIREPDTGACYYGGRVEEEYQARDEEDDECAKAIRALAAKNGWKLGEGHE